VAYLARLGLEVVERRDGVRDPELRALVAELAREARAARYDVGPVASVTSITEAPSLRRWVVCGDCGEQTDRPRRGLCDRCRKRRARAG
jgi:hypothetical protein